MTFYKSMRGASPRIPKVKLGSEKPVEITIPKIEQAPKPMKLEDPASAVNYDPLKSKYSRLQAQFRKRF